MKITQAELFFEGNSGGHKINLQLKLNINTPTLSSSEDEFSLIEKIKENHSRYQVSVNFKKDTFVRKCFLRIPFKINKNDNILINGIQSWTSTHFQKVTQSIPKINPIFFDFAAGSGDSTFFKPNNAKNPWSFDYTMLDAEPYTVIGHHPQTPCYHIFEWNYKEQYIDIHADWAIIKNNRSMLIDFVVVENTNNRKVLEDYLQIIGLKKQVQKPVTGWTSWYNYYTQINRNIIQENINNIKTNNYPIDIFQIDDGFQKAIGDWTQTNEKFPGGMKKEADAIHQSGWKAGLWLAPFICEYKSDIYQHHYDWILKYDDESPVVAGYNPGWGGASHPKYFTLDIYHPQFRAYLKNVFDTVLIDWGFDLVKLDFLFAAGLHPRQNKSRYEVMNDGMKLLRELCGNKLILGCGVPLSPSYAEVDYCRIGPDIGLHWETVWMKAVNVRERISTVNAIKNSLARVHLNHYAFGNDPDVFILREENNFLDDEQKKCLVLTNIICGALVFTSDNVGNYSTKQSSFLKQIFPHRNKNITSVKMDENFAEIKFDYLNIHYLGIINYGKRLIKKEFSQPLFDAESGLKINTVNIPAYSAKIFIEPNDRETIQFAGSTCHLLPGNELDKLEINAQSINLTLNKNLQKGCLFFHTQLKEIEINQVKYYSENGKIKFEV